MVGQLMQIKKFFNQKEESFFQLFALHRALLTTIKIMNANLLFVVTLVLVTISSCKEKTYLYEKPNIVLIYADDLGYGDLGCYNENSKIITPSIDKLATQGMLFTDAHSTDALCTPSRYALLTGRYCWRTRIKRGAMGKWGKPLIKKKRLTLPEMLKDKGYQTVAIGKWHLGWDWPTNDTLSAKEANGYNVDYSKPISGGPTEHGFDYYFGNNVPNFPPYTFIENDKVTVIPTVMKPDSIFGHKGMMAENWKLEKVLPTLAEKTVNYINEKSTDQDPFFLYLPLTAPQCDKKSLTITV
jgi:arylsulfatase A